jgi:hypothetical protein
MIHRPSRRSDSLDFLKIAKLPSYSVDFPAAFTLAHLARAISASLAFTAGLIRRSAFLAAFGVARFPFALAHLAFAPAMMAALPAALNRRLPVFGPVALILAHLALAAAAIRARPAADMWRFFGAAIVDGLGIPSPPTTEFSSPSRVAIRSLMAIMRLSWPIVKSVRFVIGDR